MTPAKAPGGWCLLGQTPLRILDVASPQLVPYRPGDTIAYFPIEESEWATYENRQMRPEQ